MQNDGPKTDWMTLYYQQTARLLAAEVAMRDTVNVIRNSAEANQARLWKLADAVEETLNTLKG